MKHAQMLQNELVTQAIYRITGYLCNPEIHAFWPEKAMLNVCDFFMRFSKNCSVKFLINATCLFSNVECDMAAESARASCVQGNLDSCGRAGTTCPKQI